MDDSLAMLYVVEVFNIYMELRLQIVDTINGVQSYKYRLITHLVPNYSEIFNLEFEKDKIAINYFNSHCLKQIAPH